MLLRQLPLRMYIMVSFFPDSDIRKLKEYGLSIFIERTIENSEKRNICKTWTYVSNERYASIFFKTVLV